MIACCLAALALPAAASAAPPVTNTNDSGSGSLRAAILSASPGDTIHVPAGTYRLTSGPIFVPGAVQLAGAGAAQTVIDGGGQRILYTASSLSVSGLTFADGHVTSGGGNDGGAAIKATGGNLTIAGSAFTNNSVTITDGSGDFNGGGAIYITGGGSIAIANTSFSGNQASVDRGKDNGGGAIFASGGGPVTVSGSSFSGDSYTETNADNLTGGGGIYSASGSVTVSASRFTGESATLHSGSLALSDAGGGAIWSGGGVALSGSSITGSSASVGPGAFRNGGGGIYNQTGPLSLTASTIARNTVSLSLVGLITNGGGGVFNDNNDGSGSGGVTISDATISGNAVSATATAGGNEASAGGLYEYGGGGSIVNSTIAGNSVSFPGGQVGGGGIYETGPFTSVRLTLKNTILAGNMLTPATPASRNCDFDSTGAQIVSAGHNLADDATCNLTAIGDQPNTDPGLGPLALNGGPNETQALLAGSKAIDHGDNAGCPPVDERGVKRPAGAACDIGAYEFAPPRTSGTLAQCTGAFRATLVPAAGSSAGILFVRVDRGPKRAFVVNGSSARVSLSLPSGRHTVEYWGQGSGGDAEQVHHTISAVVDLGLPALTITSDQHTRVYRRGARGSVTIRAGALSGLLVNPSRRHVRISTARLGAFTLKRTAVSGCRRSRTARFVYRVVKPGR